MLKSREARINQDKFNVLVLQVCPQLLKAEILVTVMI